MNNTTKAAFGLLALGLTACGSAPRETYVIPGDNGDTLVDRTSRRLSLTSPGTNGNVDHFNIQPNRFSNSCSIHQALINPFDPSKTRIIETDITPGVEMTQKITADGSTSTFNISPGRLTVDGQDYWGKSVPGADPVGEFRELSIICNKLLNNEAVGPVPRVLGLGFTRLASTNLSHTL